MVGTNLKIKEIKLKNFRPFEDVSIEFSMDSKKSITIIEGNNSTGKTSLINAMYWCIYGDEHFLNVGEGKPIPNQNSLNNTKVGDSCQTSVTITISDDKGPKYQISRILNCTRNNKDTEKKHDVDAGGQIDSGFTTTISLSFSERDRSGNWDTTDDPARFLDRATKFLPEKII